MGFLWEKKHPGTLARNKESEVRSVDAVRTGCLEGALGFASAQTSALFLTLKPRLRLGGHEQYCEVASTSATSLTSHLHCPTADEWQMRLDCAQMENDFLRKRLQQCEERLDSEMKARTELEQKVRGWRSRPQRPRGRCLLPPYVRPLFCLVLEKEGVESLPLEQTLSLWDVGRVFQGKDATCLESRSMSEVWLW